MAAWASFYLKINFKEETIEITLFIKKYEHNILLVKIYVGYIIFDTNNKFFCKYFSDMMQIEFEIYIMGELWYFLGLQIYQLKEDTFINQANYFIEIQQRFWMKK